MNKKTTLAAGLAAIMAAGVLALTASHAAFAADANNVNIDIVPDAASKAGNAFSPDSAEAHVGDTVTWTNKDSTMHTATSGADGKSDGKFGVKADGSPNLIAPNSSQQFKPTAAGEYSYFCMLHPTMVGKLKVE